MADSKGLSLVEIVVVTGITAILCLMLFTKLKPSSSFDQARMEFVNYLKMAQNSALTGQTCCGLTENIPENYKIVADISASTYTLQAEKIILQSFQLPAGIEFYECADDAGVVYDPCEIEFSLPAGKLTVNSAPVNEYLSVVLFDPKISSIQVVMINALSGLIY